ncbi:DUF6037 family protein [Halobacillus sp. ACCC02827]|uniref:DUF6037 family protein n=1 Tax=unclassified Halobacillus TaxID=2636472 RepID=UPI000A5C2C02|nr:MULTISPECIES: DUF6037 family protein [unclassified Halobacillus]WJE16373.1 DUF6037 family protein [Halobacillus sp. ACCC02827]
MGNDNKTELRFKNLPFLLKDMKKKGWVIDSFPFQYKGKKYIVILTLYNNSERKPSKYAKASVEFILWKNTAKTIKGYIDFYNVKFYSASEFCTFFDIEIGNANRDLFDDFSLIFSKFIPKSKLINKECEIEKRLVGSRAEGTNPNAIYCYDVRRNGTKKDGKPNKRSIGNSNKAQILRPELYSIYSADPNLSFYFSDKKEDEKSDDEIKRAFSTR